MGNRKKIRWFVILAVPIAAGCLWSFVRKPTPLRESPIQPALLKEFVSRMMLQEAADTKSWEGRSGLSHLQQLLPMKFWLQYYLVQYAEEKVISQGSRVTEPLLELLTDPTLPHDIRWAAGMALARLDDPRIAKAFLDAAERSLITEPQLRILLCNHLPLEHPGSCGNNSVEWLRTFVHKDYAEARLELFDRIYINNDVNMVWAESNARRWLNRYDGEDFDVLLAVQAPAALQFRNAQIEKGYDPIHTFYRFRLAISCSADSEAVNTVFARTEDQIACDQLLKLSYPELSPLMFSADCGNREDTLRKWYRENRPYFVYDFKKHRFVVQKPVRTTSQPATSAPAINQISEQIP